MFRYRFVVVSWIVVCLLGAPAFAGAQLLYGIAENNHLVVTELTAPHRLVADIPVTGLRETESIRAIDFRPHDGQLYALVILPTDRPTGHEMWLYRIHMLTGAATRITNVPFVIPLPPAAKEADLDFDPRTDQIRIVLDTGMNLRADPDTGRLIDANPTMPGTQGDEGLAGALDIGAVAYSDNFTGAGVTTLYGIDAATDTLVLIGGLGGNPSPNEGGVATPVGALGVDVKTFAGLDIMLPGNQAYASIALSPTETKLYRIDLTTGGASEIGTMPTSGGTGVRDIAVLSRRTMLYLLTSDNRIVRVFSNKLDVILNDFPVTGLPPFAKLRAIDFRPSTGVLYAISDQGLLYTIDGATGAATLVGTTGIATLDYAAMAFDPVTDELRLATPGISRRIDLATTPMTVTTPTDLPPIGTVALAYALHAPPVSTSVLFGINVDCNCLTRASASGSSAFGQLAPLSSTAGFDIDPTSNTAYLSLDVAATNTLYVVDLANGALSTTIGAMLPGKTVVALAVEPTGTVEFALSSAEINESAGSVTVTLQRAGGLSWPFAIDVTAGGTARSADDYGTFTRTLQFQGDELTKTFTIPIVNDTYYEGPYETLTLTLESPTHGARVNVPSTMTIKIVEDDPPTAPPPPQPPSPPTPPTPPPPTPTTYTALLAEGATGPFFDLDILLANPSSSATTVTLTFLKEDGSVVADTRTLPATSRTTVRVDEIPALESTSMSTVVTSDRPVVVERTMRWAHGAGYGSHTEKAVDGAASTWYFAEGSQGFFSTYVLLANPHAVENTATVAFLRESEPPVTRTYTLAPRSRFTVDASTDDELVNRSFGMIVTFALPAVAERAMYFGTDPLWKAGHESAGVTSPSTSWFLAEGATGPFFETFVLLSNPQHTAADVTLTYLIADGSPVTKTKTVPAQGRLTVNLEQEDPALANAAVATQIVSSVPIVVERAQYWPFTFDQWYEAHNSFGVVTTDRRWGLAEGRVGGPEAYETYILLANPGTTAATATITFLRANGTTLTKTFTVPAQSRFNVSTGPSGLVPELANEEFSAVIDADRPIAVERAMYASPGGLTWAAGTNATATRLAMP